MLRQEVPDTKEGMNDVEEGLQDNDNDRDSDRRDRHGLGYSYITGSYTDRRGFQRTPEVSSR